MSHDVPNAFIQTRLKNRFKRDEKKHKERVIMKIKGRLVELLCQIDPQVYGKQVIYQNGVKTLYVVCLAPIYGMLEASLYFYEKFRGDLEEAGYIFNSYDPCVCNKKIKGLQHTVRFHVDDVLSSHM